MNSRMAKRPAKEDSDLDDLPDRRKRRKTTGSVDGEESAKASPRLPRMMDGQAGKVFACGYPECGKKFKTVSLTNGRVIRLQETHNVELMTEIRPYHSHSRNTSSAAPVHLHLPRLRQSLCSSGKSDEALRYSFTPISAGITYRR